MQKRETDYQSNIERHLLSVLGLHKMLESFYQQLESFSNP
jgi:hypothetical protein